MNNSVDFNSNFDFNVGVVLGGVNSVVDFNVSDLNNSVDFNVFSDVNGFDLNGGSDGNFQVVSDVSPDLSGRLSFLSGFFVGSVESVFSSIGRLVSVGFDFFRGFFSFDGFETQNDKNFVLNQRDVFVNGRLVKCIGSACDKVPLEVD